MNEKDFDRLVQMAVELEEFERGAGLAPTTRGALGTIVGRAVRGHTLLWRLGAPLAAAAAVALAFLPAHRSSTVMTAGPAVAIDYWPGVPREDGVRVDCFEPKASESCSVMAIFHSWRQECECFEWQVYEWEDGRPLAEMSPEDVHGITLDVTDAPPVEQLLLVAIAKHADDLPRDDVEADDLIACLNQAVPPAGAREKTNNAYASAARACLPDSVRVVPQPFHVK